jgi:hypothetical protein
MKNKLEVSFNSPQCGWMSIGFDDGKREFHTTTAYTPHSRALTEILKGLSSLLDAENAKDEFTIEWSRNPEAYDLRFERDGENVSFKMIEFPNFSRTKSEGETVFSYEGDVRNFCEAFYTTFQQLYAEREVDEFEENWRQPFPFEEYEHFQEEIKNYGQ